jgi:hypothetical protein
MKTNFLHRVKKGRAWEDELEKWMNNYFLTQKPNWAVKNSTHVHRDSSGNQFPDYIIYQQHNPKKYYFLDAKERIVYRHRNHCPSFGFDKTFFQSYRNIAVKHQTKVYVAFRDNNFDANHLYMLDINQPPDFVWNYGLNGQGEPLCYRWCVHNLKKFKLQ